jgi:hypothetical protein
MEFAMKKMILTVLAVLPLLTAGCAGLMAAVTGETSAIDESTSIFHSDGSFSWAAKLNNQARLDADNKATRQRQVTQQQTEWVFVAWDYEFNQGELKAGIAQGKYKLGMRRSQGLSSDGINTLWAYEVLVPRTKNVTNTVTEVDKELWQQTYAQSLTYRRDWIRSQLQSTNVSSADESASPTRKKVMARLEKRLRENLLPGTRLVYGGWTGDRYEQQNVLYAYLDDDGSFVCKWYK